MHLPRLQRHTSRRLHHSLRSGIPSSLTSHHTQARDTSHPPTTTAQRLLELTGWVKVTMMAVMVPSRATLFLRRISRVMRITVVRDLQDTSSLRLRSRLLVDIRMTRMRLLALMGGSGAVEVRMRLGERLKS
jgi:hypothetical protein